MLFSFSLHWAGCFDRLKHANSLSLNCKPSVYRVCCETCRLVYKVAILSEVEERAELVWTNGTTGAGGASTVAGRQDFSGSREATSKGCPLFEMNILPLKWEARSRCIDFWLKVLRMGITG